MKISNNAIALVAKLMYDFITTWTNQVMLLVSKQSSARHTLTIHDFKRIQQLLLSWNSFLKKNMGYQSKHGFANDALDKHVCSLVKARGYTLRTHDTIIDALASSVEHIVRTLVFTVKNVTNKPRVHTKDIVHLLHVDRRFEFVLHIGSLKNAITNVSCDPNADPWMVRFIDIEGRSSRYEMLIQNTIREHVLSDDAKVRLFEIIVNQVVAIVQNANQIALLQKKKNITRRHVKDSLKITRTIQKACIPHLRNSNDSNDPRYATPIESQRFKPFFEHIETSLGVLVLSQNARSHMISCIECYMILFLKKTCIIQSPKKKTITKKQINLLCELQAY